MTRQRAVFFLFVLLVSAVAIFLTLSTTPSAPADLGFNTPTPTPTATFTPEFTPTPTLKIEASSSVNRSNCTFPYQEWARYPSTWGLESVRVGDLAFSLEDVAAIFASNSSDVYTSLLQQLFGAMINQRNGADPSAVIGTLTGAMQWLAANPGATSIAEEQRLQGLAFAKSLSDYNVGTIGPGRCPFALLTPTPTVTHTPLVTSTFTPTITPTFTRVPTRSPFGLFPTSTQRSGGGGGGGGRPRPTATDAPQPTNPPPPPTGQPTDEPRPTATDAPP